ncbi:MAG: hypothetical protein ACLRSW_02020 [Christensenellaceae bacterium]
MILKGLPEAVAPVLGKVACGLVLCVGFCIAVAIVGLLLKLIQKAVAQVAVLRFIDGVLSTLLMMALGAVICALLMAVLYTLQHYGIFEGSRLFETNSSLSQGFYAAFDQYLKPVFEKISQKNKRLKGDAFLKGRSKSFFRKGLCLRAARKRDIRGIRLSKEYCFRRRGQTSDPRRPS